MPPTIPPSPRLSSPLIPEGLPFPMPIVLPNAPTLGRKLSPVFRVIWLQPNRASFTRLLLIVRVQSPTVFQIGAVDEPFAKSGCELVLGLFWYARVNRPLMRSLLVAW